MQSNRRDVNGSDIRVARHDHLNQHIGKPAKRSAMNYAKN